MALHEVPEESHTDCQDCENHKGEAGQETHNKAKSRGHIKRTWEVRELTQHRLVCRARRATFGDKKTSGQRYHQGRDLSDQTVADCQDGIVGRCLHRRQIMADDPDQDAADDIYQRDDQTRDSVASDEFGRTVHRPEEAAFILKRLAAHAGFIFGDHACAKVGVDGHLLAGHCVQAKACRDFGNPGRAFGDDNEVDDHEDRKDHDPDDEIAAHHKPREALDHLTRCARARVTLRQDQARRRHVQREPEHSHYQQQCRERVKLQWRWDPKRDHQDQN